MKVYQQLYLYITILNISMRYVLSNNNNHNNKRIMVWMCLEFCEESQIEIQSNLLQINKYKHILNAVSFEKYTLGPNSTLIDNNLTEVSSTIISYNLEAWPLLSSYPHPPEFIDWMRQVFQNPKPFLNSCVEEAIKYNYKGYNLDWEPTDNVTEQDGNDYAKFINIFANQLHQHDLKLSVDIATWSPIWNYDMIAKTNIDKAISMGTYTSTDTSFTTQLDLLIDSFGIQYSGVGLETVNASTNGRIPLNEVSYRFQEMKLRNVTEIDIWDMPIPPLWWPFLEDFKIY